MNGEAPAGAVEFLLQRRRLPSRRLRACRRCVRPRSPCRSRQSRRGRGRRSRPCREEHVDAVAEAHTGVDRLRLFATGRLSPVRAPRRVEIGVLDDAGVGRNLVAGLDQHDVAGHDLVRATRWRSPSRITVDSGAASAIRARTEVPRAPPGKSRAGRSAPRSQDDDRLIGQRAFARVLQQPFDHRDDDGDEQNDDKEILELLEQPLPPGRLGRALELVRTVLLEPPLRFGAE